MEKIIELTDLVPDQKVKMKEIFVGQFGRIEKQITSRAYEIRVGNMSIVATLEFFDIIPE